MSELQRDLLWIRLILLLLVADLSQLEAFSTGPGPDERLPHFLGKVCFFTFLGRRVQVFCTPLYSPTPVIRNLGYPKPRLSERGSERGVCLKKVVFLIKIAVSATQQSTSVCVSYVHVQCRHTVVRYRVQCEL